MLTETFVNMRFRICTLENKASGLSVKLNLNRYINNP